MNRFIITSATALALVAAPVFADKEAAPNRQATEAKCARWAAETNVAEKDKTTYIKDCVRELTVPDTIKPEQEEGE